jgi:hypothetical protein
MPDGLHQQRFFGTSRNHSRTSIPALFPALPRVEAQAGFLTVRPVTFHAVCEQQWSNADFEVVKLSGKILSNDGTGAFAEQRE